MKLLQIILISIFILFQTLDSRSQTSLKGSSMFSLGLGTGNLTNNTHAFFFNNYPGYKKKIHNSIHLKYEYYKEKMSIGLSVSRVKMEGKWDSNGLNSSSYSYIEAGSYIFTSTSIILRFNYSVMMKEKINFYFGSGAGLKINKFTEYNTYNSETDDSKPIFPISIELTFGMRYFIIPNVGLYTEFGIAKSIINGGIVFKIN